MDLAERSRHIGNALRYAGGTHRTTDIDAGIASGRFQCWTGPHSVMVTEIEQYPTGRCLHFFLAGGRLGELRLMTPHVLQWGREQGCTRATLTGRPGWSRSFLTKEMGWRQLPIVLLEARL